MLRQFWIFFFLSFAFLQAHGQRASAYGKVSHGGDALAGVGVYTGKVLAGFSNDKGEFKIEGLMPGRVELRFTFTGMKTVTRELILAADESVSLHVEMLYDLLGLSELVVTASRERTEMALAPVMVSTISSRTFEHTQSVSLAEGLAYTPGLRVENNCQNCGFTQVRINGLDGAYSQVLINSRPVFSALAGIYGLELIPANMVERVEVVRGGGSVLYGGNAIAGTINIITKDPLNNSFSAGGSRGWLPGGAQDNVLNGNVSLVSDDLMKGGNVYYFNRNRDGWDANNDGFTEITQLESITAGGDFYIRTGLRSKIAVGGYLIGEERRGGSTLHLLPHQSSIAEWLRHRIGGGHATWEAYSKDYRHRLSLYSSAQVVNRESYYGTGGRVIVPGDSLSQTDIVALNAYGTARDVTAVGGLQHSWDLITTLTITSGTEYRYNRVNEEMAAYARLNQQRVQSTGTYVQATWKPLEKLSVTAGGRYELVQIHGDYRPVEGLAFADRKNLAVWLPRVSALYHHDHHTRIRAGYAQGYRAPQAFDEDLHVETVGGAVRFVRLDAALEPERSHSYTASVSRSFELQAGQLEASVEGFSTLLEHAFILSEPFELPSGVSVITRRNGSGAIVQGMHGEVRLALLQKWQGQAGFTIQRAAYREPELLWEGEGDIPGLEAVRTKRMLRVPESHGFITLTYRLTPEWAIHCTGVHTGSMKVARMTDPNTEYITLKTTPTFFENHWKLVYRVRGKSRTGAEFYGGVQNLFNSYQRDFDTGFERDAGYVYGPLRPRTFFAGLRIFME